jgi:hypothetical protein
MSSSADIVKRLLTPRAASSPAPPQVQSEETEQKVLEIIAHFSEDRYDLPVSSGPEGHSEERTPLSERELIFLVSLQYHSAVI